MNHDAGYKLLFSHPEMVSDLLHGYIEEDWVNGADFSSLERLSGGKVAGRRIGNGHRLGGDG